ncbi:hypothetical protein FNI11_03600 [Salmonella enterica subsp. salamae]|nr:hypothetical protein [Salmonella enterica subsp. salamae]ECJ2280008.1 hypothetical protein [Salmonella enterica subsp. salamae]
MNQRHPNLNNIISANANFSYMLLINTRLTTGNIYMQCECIDVYTFTNIIYSTSHFAKKMSSKRATKRFAINFVKCI